MANNPMIIMFVDYYSNICNSLRMVHLPFICGYQWTTLSPRSEDKESFRERERSYKELKPIACYSYTSQSCPKWSFLILKSCFDFPFLNAQCEQEISKWNPNMRPLGSEFTDLLKCFGLQLWNFQVLNQSENRMGSRDLTRPIRGQDKGILTNDIRAENDRNVTNKQ